VPALSEIEHRRVDGRGLAPLRAGLDADLRPGTTTTCVRDVEHRERRRHDCGVADRWRGQPKRNLAEESVGSAEGT